LLQPGERIGRYEIQAAIGEGGFGQVYLAHDSELGRPVAIKALSRERLARAPAQYTAYRERFKLERRVQGQFQHPHIVSVYDLVQQDGDEYLVEEFVPGGTLCELIQRQGRLSPQRVVQIGVEMCQAIAAAWEQDVVHRDIKPSNILLTDDGHVKLTDFGVAQVGQLSQRTQSDNHHPGTPAYMSPEQEKGYGYLDERSDLYALGLVLYEALSTSSFKRERVSVRQLEPEVPQALDKVITRALAHDPAERYQSAAEFEAALRQALDRPRPAWLWWLGGAAIILLALAASQWLPAHLSWGLDAPTATATSRPPQTPTLPVPTSTGTQTATLTTPAPGATHTPSPTPSVTLTSGETPTSTLTVSPQPTQATVVSAPWLISPPGASETRSSYLTLRWGGALPNADYGFRVSLRHGSGAPDYNSPILNETQWEIELPGDAVGEWRWSVAVVLRGETQALARSDEWTFYYSPFDAPPPVHSPLSEPLNSSLTMP
jgi:serine/threonine protein kinase